MRSSVSAAVGARVSSRDGTLSVGDINPYLFIKTFLKKLNFYTNSMSSYKFICNVQERSRVIDRIIYYCS